MNPADSWPATQAANGLGADAPPPTTPKPFTYVGAVPFPWYFSQSISPWGRMPHGPAYAAPRPQNCPGCVGLAIKPGVGSVVEASRANDAGDIRAAVNAMRRAVAGLGASCGPCQITDGERCLPCPPNADVDECRGCVDGQPVVESRWYEHPLAGPVAIGVITSVAAALTMTFLRRRKVPVE
jgi:hypothetical protein